MTAYAQSQPEGQLDPRYQLNLTEQRAEEEKVSLKEENRKLLQFSQIQKINEIDVILYVIFQDSLCITCDNSLTCNF